ncbi:PREDICTED: leucine-rich repeat-containing protein 37A2-like, partial [Elephantulus edwardii]|uniref:leucine-rich repeat-containing protein 37A2-like n=1 Tax=Elephantulus edwardii TaxID=28737 RepID=UPI0003F0C359
MSLLYLCALLLLTPQLLLPAAPLNLDLKTPDALDLDAPLTSDPADLDDSDGPDDLDDPGAPDSPDQPADLVQSPDLHQPHIPLQRPVTYHSPPRQMPLPKPGAFENREFRTGLRKLPRTQGVPEIPGAHLGSASPLRPHQELKVPLRNEVGIPDLSRAEAHQSLRIPFPPLASQSSTPADFIFPRPKWNKDLSQGQPPRRPGRPPDNYDPQVQVPSYLLQGTHKPPEPLEENTEPPGEEEQALPTSLYPIDLEPSGLPPVSPQSEQMDLFAPQKEALSPPPEASQESELCPNKTLCLHPLRASTLETPQENPILQSTLYPGRDNQVSEEFALTLEPVQEVQSGQTLQEAPVQPSNSAQEVKPAVEQEVLAPLPEQEVEPYVVHQKAPPQFPRPSEEIEPVPGLEKSSKPPEILSSSRTQQEVPGSPLEFPEGTKYSMPEETTALPPMPHKEANPFLSEQEALFPTNQQNTTQFQEPLDEVEPIPDQHEYTSEPPEFMEEWEPFTVMQDTQAQSSEWPTEGEHSLLQLENALPPPASTEEVEAPAALQEASVHPEAFLKEIRTSAAQHAYSMEPADYTESLPFPSYNQEASTQRPELPENEAPSIIQNNPGKALESPQHVVTQLPGNTGVTISSEVQYPTPPPLLHKVIVSPTRHYFNVPIATAEPLSQTLAAPQKPTVPSSAFPQLPISQEEQSQAQNPNLNKFTTKSLDYEIPTNQHHTIEMEYPSVTSQKTTGPSSEFFKMTFYQVQDKKLNTNSVTENPLKLGLSETIEYTIMTKDFIAQKKVIPPSEDHEETPLNPDQVQGQQLKMTKVIVQPLALEINVPSETNLEIQLSPEKQGTPTQPPESFHKVVDTTGSVRSSNLQKSIAPPTNQVTLDIDISVSKVDNRETGLTSKNQETPAQTAEPPKGGEAQFTTHPQEPSVKVEYMTTKHPASVPPPSQEITHHSNVPDVTVEPWTLELTLAPEPKTQVVESSPTQQDQTTLSLEHPEKILTQSPVYNQVTVDSTGQDQGQTSKLPDVIVSLLDLPLTTTPQFTSETAHSLAVEETASPTKQSTLKSFTETRALQTASPPKQVTVQLVSPELVVTQHPASSEAGLSSPVTQHTFSFIPEKEHMSPSGPPTQSAKNRNNADICDLCVCQNATLSCTGLPKEKKLRRVPVPEPNTYNSTFTVLNLQGNNISYIDKNVWKAYRWTEKLILSDNFLTELRKDSFEGLLSLQYLDLSCNKIQYIERGTFDALPFLQYVDLGCNIITEVPFGSFQTWHGLQFLNTLVLNRNPLTTIEDPYLYKLPSLNYLDLGATQVSLKTVENILPVMLQLQNLILPSRPACCLCQFKSTIEVVCNTVKMSCNSECLQSIFCGEEAFRMAKDGTFMKALKARKKSHSTELTIEPEKPLSDGSGVTLDRYEIQLNQELQPVIPNNDVRTLLSHVVRTLKMDCSQPEAQLACAKLLSRTGLLLKLLNEQQEAKMAKTGSDTEQWKTNLVNKEDTEIRSESKAQETDKHTKEKKKYNYLYIVSFALSVTAIVIVFILIFCLIK